jgi:putative flavoprotein involved in K+ transport
MRTHVETLIIGAGQAGLALSHHLTAAGRDHLLLDRGRVGERWRSERWDSFTLLTPNWLTGLPGMDYAGDDPDGFLDKPAVVQLFERYARSFDAPVRTGVAVHRVRRCGSRWLALTDDGTYVADDVVIATGHHDVPRIPLHRAERLPARIHQLHTSHYRNPAQLPAGGVLVVGAGPSGQQIAEELALTGRRVVIAAGRHRTMPRRYRGRDAAVWMARLGSFDRTIDSLADPGAVRSAPAFVQAGGHHDLDLRRLVAAGARPAGRLSSVSGGTVWFADDLAATVAEADANVTAVRSAVDEHLRRTGEPAAPAEPLPPPPGAWVHDAPTHIDLDEAAISTVVWATGYRRDYSWIDAPVFDATGEPLQRRGVTAAPGLYFLGLRWMYRRGSDTIHGVGADAEHLAAVIGGRHAAPALSAVRSLRGAG